MGCDSAQLSPNEGEADEWTLYGGLRGAFQQSRVCEEVLNGLARPLGRGRQANDCKRVQEAAIGRRERIDIENSRRSVQSNAPL